MSVEKRIECVKEFFLRTLFASEKLDVVNQKKIGLAITLPELDQITVLDRIDELVDEQFARDVDHLHVFLLRPNILADGLHQMGLAKTDTAINEQRVVRACGRLRHGQTAACAISLFGPTTKDSNVFRGLSPGTVAPGFVSPGGSGKTFSSGAASSVGVCVPGPDGEQNFTGRGLPNVVTIAVCSAGM